MGVEMHNKTLCWGSKPLTWSLNGVYKLVWIDRTFRG